MPSLTGGFPSSTRRIRFSNVYFALKFGKGVEEPAADSPMVKVRNIFFEYSCQFPLSGVFIGLEAVVKRIGPITTETGGNHAADEVAHSDDQRVADRSSE
jgi:hypothetical protein